MTTGSSLQKYYRELGVYQPLPFSAGTALTFVKELIRLVVVERKVRGTSHLFRGLRDGRRILRDTSWTPMPPLERAQPVG